MITLIIETSGPVAWIARCEGEKILDFTTLAGGHSLSARLHPALEQFVKKPFNAIAIGVGPGSYAGSRTAATIGKTLSYALDKPLIPFPSPLGFLPSRPGRFAYLADAKMGEIALFKGDFDSFELIKKEEILLHLNEVDWVVAEEKYRLDETWLLPTPNPELVALYIQNKFNEGCFCSAEELKVSYFRD